MGKVPWIVNITPFYSNHGTSLLILICSVVQPHWILTVPFIFPFIIEKGPTWLSHVFWSTPSPWLTHFFKWHNHHWCTMHFHCHLHYWPTIGNCSLLPPSLSGINERGPKWCGRWSKQPKQHLWWVALCPWDQCCLYLLIQLYVAYYPVFHVGILIWICLWILCSGWVSINTKFIT